MYQGYLTLFSVFTITPSKIKIETIQYRKYRIWEMKEDKYAKGLAKNQVGAVFHMKDTKVNVLPKCIRLCMETPHVGVPLRSTNSGRKPAEASVFEFFYKNVNSSLKELIKIK